MYAISEFTLSDLDFEKIIHPVFARIAIREMEFRQVSNRTPSAPPPDGRCLHLHTAGLQSLQIGGRHRLAGSGQPMPQAS
jgi:hypothetical protein